MFARNVIRIAAVAVGLSTLSFAAGVAGDLSLADPPNYGERVVLRIPPELPADSMRAGPLPPVISTASAEAATLRQNRFTPIRVRTANVEVLVNDEAEFVLVSLPKWQPVWLTKSPERRKDG